MASLARLFMGKTSKAKLSNDRQTPSWSPPNRELAKLEIHDYFVRHWLSHAFELDASDFNDYNFRRLCTHTDSELLPWLQHTAEESKLYKQIVLYAVMNRHLPLLRAVRDHIKSQKPKILADVFESHCQGTNVRLVHMTAALGYTDVL